MRRNGGERRQGRTEVPLNHGSTQGIRRVIKNSNLIFAAVDGEKRLIGFVRVLTDFAYRCYLLDLIVDPKYRGKGLGRALMKKVLSHPQLKRVERIDLHCLPPMIPFYKKF